MADASIQRTGRYSPTGSRYYSTSPFEKRKWETMCMFSQGCGERPDFTKQSSIASPFLSPATYTPKLSSSKKDVVYTTLTMKSKHSKPDRKFDLIPPGPGYYTVPTSPPIRAVAIQNRHSDSRLFTESTQRPGPGSYTTITTCGKYRPAFSITGRPYDSVVKASVGPGQYEIKGVFDKY
jgi:hypothetical protein